MRKGNIMTRTYHTIESVCEELSIHRGTLYTWIKKGKFPAGTKIGGGLLVRWPANVVDEYFARCSGSQPNDLQPVRG